ncbi:peptidoglycan-associated lipoprotein Pal, partial [Campylobacter jejuni]|nr:peptidoglycan-associated lipoprotein Pal [Campylobacter jejuni]
SDGWDIDSKISQLNDTLNKVYFDFDKFNIRPDMQNVVSTNANIFNTEVSGVSITVEGNCDEWGTDEYNQALGLKRAKAVKEALIAKGVNADRIAVKSYGETNPVCTEKTKACDAQNRRAEFKLSR